MILAEPEEGLEDVIYGDKSRTTAIIKEGGVGNQVKSGKGVKNGRKL